MFGFGKMVEVVRVFAQVNESSVARAVGRIRPRHHQHRIVCGTLCGPFRKHHIYLSVTERAKPQATENSSMRQQKSQQRMFGPVAVVAAGLVRLGKKGTMSAVYALD